MTTAQSFDCAADREKGLEAAVQAIRNGELVVAPTDTIYGVAADAFNPAAVQRLLDAKGRGRQKPPPVLIASAEMIDTLAIAVPLWLRSMVKELWPGPLTVIVTANPSLSWDLGQTGGTVALRIPDEPIMLDLIARTGPLAVSSANRSGEPAACTAEGARQMLGDNVSVYLDGGPSAGQLASTIIDTTMSTSRVVRSGPVSLERLHEFNNTILSDEEARA